MKVPMTIARSGCMVGKYIIWKLIQQVDDWKTYLAMNCWEAYA